MTELWWPAIKDKAKPLASNSAENILKFQTSRNVKWKCHHLLCFSYLLYLYDYEGMSYKLLGAMDILLD